MWAGTRMRVTDTDGWNILHVVPYETFCCEVVSTSGLIKKCCTCTTWKYKSTSTKVKWTVTGLIFLWIECVLSQCSTSNIVFYSIWSNSESSHDEFWSSQIKRTSVWMKWMSFGMQQLMSKRHTAVMKSSTSRLSEDAWQYNQQSVMSRSCLVFIRDFWYISPFEEDAKASLKYQSCVCERNTAD